MRNHPPSRVEPIVETVIKAMRDDYNVKKLGGAGYCLGAKYVCRFMASGKGLDAGYIAHPSATTGDEVKGIDGPLTIAAAGKFGISLHGQGFVLSYGRARRFIPAS